MSASESASVVIPPASAAPHARPLTRDEAAEFACALGVRPEAIRALERDPAGPLSPEIENYDQLISDPLKTRLTLSPDFFARVKADLARRIVARHQPERDVATLRVLDVGCGTGALMRCLGEEYGEVYGCDPSSAMVSRAGDRARRMPAPTEIPFPTGTFDVAVCACVYHHIEPRLRARHLAEIQRVLRPGGVLLVFEHNPLNPITRRIVRRCPLDEGARLLAGWETKSLLRQAGYQHVRNRYYLFLPEVLYRRVGILEGLLSFTALGGQYCTSAVAPGVIPVPTRFIPDLRLAAAGR